LLWEK